MASSRTSDQEKPWVIISTQISCTVHIMWLLIQSLISAPVWLIYHWNHGMDLYLLQTKNCGVIIYSCHNRRHNILIKEALVDCSHWLLTTCTGTNAFSRSKFTTLQWGYTSATTSNITGNFKRSTRGTSNWPFGRAVIKGAVISNTESAPTQWRHYAEHPLFLCLIISSTHWWRRSCLLSGSNVKRSCHLFSSPHISSILNGFHGAVHQLLCPVYIYTGSK